MGLWGHESLGRGDEFMNSNWFAFQDDKMGDATMPATSPSEMMDEINLNESSTIDNTSHDNDVVVGVDKEFLDSKLSNSTPNWSPNLYSENYEAIDKTSTSDAGFFRFESTENEDLFVDRPMPEWVG